MSVNQSDACASAKVYVVAHKEAEFPSDALYVPIQVGSGAAFLDVRDSEGYNIANKNPTFCELTALYWIWKNDSSSDIVGLAHYRRFLTKRWYSNSEEYYLDADDIRTALSAADIILPKKFRWRKPTVREYYSMADGYDADYERCRDVVSRFSPDYLSAFDKVSESHAASYCNMMICRKPLFDSYCEWLFTILFEMERLTNLEGYTTMERRIFGFLSEILLNVWVEKNQLRVAEFPMVKTDTPPAAKIKRRLTRLMYYVP